MADTKAIQEKMGELTIDQLMDMVKEFKTAYGIDSKPTTGKSGETVTFEMTMAWAINSIQQGISLMNVVHEKAPDYNLFSMMDELKKLGQEYNSASSWAHYAEARKHENPIMWAIENPTYLGVKISEVFNKEDEDRYKFDYVGKAMDLVTLHDRCKNVTKCGIDDSWIWDMDTILMCMIVRGIKEKFPDDADKVKGEALKKFHESYKIKKIVEGIDIEGNDQTTIGKLTNALRALVTKMIGEEYAKKVQKADVRFLEQVYCMRDNRKPDTVKYLTNKQFSQEILAVLRRIVLGELYKDAYKTKK